MNLVVLTGAYIKDKPDLKTDEVTKEKYARFILIYRTSLEKPPTYMLCRAEGKVGEYCFNILNRADMVELIGELGSVTVRKTFSNYIIVKSIRVLNKKDTTALADGMSIENFAELYAPSKIAERIKNRKKAYKKGEIPQ